ncbi:MAG: DEAD/DEAH box helicase [Deltaproteobacteria bacterium]|jgi:ATP-dependent RNA helicase RhlE|nr:DEAD/DEAH box helicase [Deltaproteobacteria bacterium]
MSFESFKLDDRVERGLQAAGYKKATPIQTAAIPSILAGHDVIGTAQTGTGKTAAFVLPILHNLLAANAKEPGGRRTRALIITPTRELAEQINDVVNELGKFTSLRSATVYGGVGMQPQEKALQQGVEVIVACPGRLLDHLNRGNARLDRVEVLVIDEADRMLDMGFLPSIQQIMKQTSPRRQTLLFSATFDAAVEQLAAKSMRFPQRFSMGTDAPTSTVAHTLYPVPQHLKPGLLQRLLDEMTVNSILVFTRTKHRADRVVEKIKRAGYAASALHANKSQSQRKLAVDQFRAGKIKVLVATDIAARGLDIASISHVINFDIPDSATSYIHRIGRTGRAERLGDAFTLVTHEDKDTIRDIEKILGSPIERRLLEGFNYREASDKDPVALPSRHTYNRVRSLKRQYA